MVGEESCRSKSNENLIKGILLSTDSRDNCGGDHSKGEHIKGEISGEHSEEDHSDCEDDSYVASKKDDDVEENVGEGDVVLNVVRTNEGEDEDPLSEYDSEGENNNNN